MIQTLFYRFKWIFIPNDAWEDVLMEDELKELVSDFEVWDNNKKYKIHEISDSIVI